MSASVVAGVSAVVVVAGMSAVIKTCFAGMSAVDFDEKN
jgi:hypothetical protein